VSVLLNCVLALSESVPQLDGLVTRTRDDLTVVCREGNAQNILGVTMEAASGGSAGDVPKTERSVPSTRQGKLTIRGDGHILNEVTVASQTAFRGCPVVDLPTVGMP